MSLSGSGESPLITRWSPDSTQIAYTTADQAAGQNTSVVRLRNIASGEERQLYHGRSISCIWSAQQPNLFCVQNTPQHTTEVFSISIDSSRVERLGSLPGGYGALFFGSRDDRAIYLAGWPGLELIRWEISTQQATTLDRIPGIVPSLGSLGALFPDERWMARRDKGTIEIRPMSGGDWKPLISLSPTQMAFTPDGNWVLYHDVGAAGKHSLFRVATAGGQPERLGDFPSTSKQGYLRISPDGKKIIAEARDTPEVWLLENFEPKQQAAR